MLIAAFIFVISMAATIQFGVLSWRAGLIRIAATRLNAEMDTKIQVGSNLLKNNNFLDVEVYQKLCPNVSGEPAPNLGPVRLYYNFLKLMNSVGVSASQGWAKREMDLCTRYATVVLVQRLERNQAFAFQARSY